MAAGEGPRALVVETLNLGGGLWVRIAVNCNRCALYITGPGGFALALQPHQGRELAAALSRACELFGSVDEPMGRMAPEVLP